MPLSGEVFREFFFLPDPAMRAEGEVLDMLCKLIATMRRCGSCAKLMRSWKTNGRVSPPHSMKAATSAEEPGDNANRLVGTGRSQLIAFTGSRAGATGGRRGHPARSAAWPCRDVQDADRWDTASRDDRGTADRATQNLRLCVCQNRLDRAVPRGTRGRHRLRQSGKRIQRTGNYAVADRNLSVR